MPKTQKWIKNKKKKGGAKKQKKKITPKVVHVNKQALAIVTNEDKKDAGVAQLPNGDSISKHHVVSTRLEIVFK